MAVPLIAFCKHPVSGVVKRVYVNQIALDEIRRIGVSFLVQKTPDGRFLMPDPFEIPVEVEPDEWLESIPEAEDELTELARWGELKPPRLVKF